MDQINVKNAADAKKGRNVSLVVLLIGLAICILQVLLYPNSDICIIIGTFLVLLPALLLISCFSVLNKVPESILLDQEKMVMVFNGGRREEILWTDIVYFQKFGKIRTRQGKEWNLVYLERSDYELIERYLKAAQPRDQSGWEGTYDAYGMQIPQPPPPPPGTKRVPGAYNYYVPPPPQNISVQEAITISRTPMMHVVGYSLIGLLFIPICIYLGRVVLVSNDSVERIANGILFLLGTVMIVCSVAILYQSLVKKTFTVDGNGVRFLMGNKEKFNFMWSEISEIHLSLSGPPTMTFHLTFISRSGTSGSINTEYFRTEDLRNAFFVVRKYAAKYPIELHNELGW